MLNLVLFQPEIPSNTGNLIRLSANMGANLHLIKPYGFEMNDKRLRRAGLDYKDLASVYEYDNFDDYLDKANPSKLYLVSSKVSKNYTDIKYHNNDSFLFGSETKGLPKEIFDEYEGITVPMQDGSRSLNLSNCVSIVAYEAWRQLDFAI
ncbi:MAG: tRNA (cytidine(34)-2'-O)-methyltransferase [Gammaproteobacteria bacterium]|jgi:tRNA (cytidine/uridine-2'-O-)-methyltransferase|uniref:tRNA/rRNA methyltransferase SpoU type domain-containing protein n=1 Tax=marine metagenome TaxID=408172 RepID=A0A381UQD4_9ZZZZ|nr:tRNA (cytidine(34)-2'-O)-methyltransferase [Gammaproteobacteria bacterium]|tara:strand:- start:2004 stop:2453 length:450 start_codon:yes stop_codon:yes gene_type:complete